MLARSSYIWSLGLLALPAFAFADSVKSAPFQAITVQPGQGAAVVLQLPSTPNGDATPAAYALTGLADTETQHRAIPMRTGQGDIVWVHVAD